MSPFPGNWEGGFFFARFKTRTHKVLAVALRQKRQEYYGNQEKALGWHRLFLPFVRAKKWGQELQHAPGPRWTGGLCRRF